MGLLTTLLTLPVSGPAKAAWWIAEKLHEQALAELNDPKAIKDALASLEKRLLAGEIDEAEFEEQELALLTRLRDIQRAAKRG